MAYVICRRDLAPIGEPPSYCCKPIKTPNRMNWCDDCRKRLPIWPLVLIALMSLNGCYAVDCNIVRCSPEGMSKTEVGKEWDRIACDLDPQTHLHPCLNDCCTQEK